MAKARKGIYLDNETADLLRYACYVERRSESEIAEDALERYFRRKKYREELFNGGEEEDNDLCND